MRKSVCAALVGLLAVPVHAEGLGLMAIPAQCAALESLVVFGLIDGGIGGDTAELTAVVDGADPVLCQSWLDDYGYGAGFADEDCATAWDVLARNGLPEEMMSEVPTFITTILSPASAQDCDDMLFELTAGQ